MSDTTENRPTITPAEVLKQLAEVTKALAAVSKRLRRVEAATRNHNEVLAVLAGIKKPPEKPVN